VEKEGNPSGDALNATRSVTRTSFAALKGGGTKGAVKHAHQLKSKGKGYPPAGERQRQKERRYRTNLVLTRTQAEKKGTLVFLYGNQKEDMEQ